MAVSCQAARSITTAMTTDLRSGADNVAGRSRSAWSTWHGSNACSADGSTQRIRGASAVGETDEEWHRRIHRSAGLVPLQGEIAASCAALSIAVWVMALSAGDVIRTSYRRSCAVAFPAMLSSP